MLEKLIHVEELHAKTMRGTTTLILTPGQSFIIKDLVGFEKFKLEMGATEGADSKLFLNGREILK